MRLTRHHLIILGIAVAAIAAAPVVLTLVFHPAEGPTEKQETLPSRLTASLATHRDTYVPGEPVAIAFLVRNLGPGVATIRFPSSCQAAFLVMDPDESLIYDVRSHQGCYLGFSDLTLAPDETRTFTFAWDQTSDSGLPVSASQRYRIQGFLQSSEPVPGARAEATILVTRPQAEPELALAASLDADAFDPGDSANVTVVLTNIGQDSVVMHFRTPCYVQFVVVNEEDLAVYTSSMWWGCIQVLHDEILAPGESRSWTFSWGLTTDDRTPLAPGRYQVVPSFDSCSPTTNYYQQFVSRTDAATFVVTAPDV